MRKLILWILCLSASWTLAGTLNLTNDTVLMKEPTAANHAASKNYVDNNTSAGSVTNATLTETTSNYVNKSGAILQFGIKTNYQAAGNYLTSGTDTLASVLGRGNNANGLNISNVNWIGVGPTSAESGIEPVARTLHGGTWKIADSGGLILASHLGFSAGNLGITNLLFLSPSDNSAEGLMFGGGMGYFYPKLRTEGGVDFRAQTASNGVLSAMTASGTIDLSGATTLTLSTNTPSAGDVIRYNGGKWYKGGYPDTNAAVLDAVARVAAVGYLTNPLSANLNAAGYSITNVLGLGLTTGTNATTMGFGTFPGTNSNGVYWVTGATTNYLLF